MNFYIKIEDGHPVSHPVSEENLKMFFPNLDPNNPPEGFERFVREPMPKPDGYQIYENTSYEISNYYTDKYNTRTWVDVHHMRDMTDEEKQFVIDEFKRLNPQIDDWVYDEGNKVLMPPIPRPDDGKDYIWFKNGGEWLEHPTDLTDDEIIQASLQMNIDIMKAADNIHVDVFKQILNKARQNKQK